MLSFLQKNDRCNYASKCNESLEGSEKILNKNNKLNAYFWNFKFLSSYAILVGRNPTPPQEGKAR